jgi:hypothetical protein
MWTSARLAGSTLLTNTTIFQRARQLPLGDFEDALVASVAEATGSDYIVTRNVSDFAGSPVPALTPTEFLEAIIGIEAE